MRFWLRTHRVLAALVWATLSLAAAEGLLVYYYLNSWFIMPLL
jgi:hypothetical protein